MEWSNENVLEFLDAYKKEPVIWNASHVNHKNRNFVYDAWKRIENTLGGKYSVAELKKKKDSLMASFRPLYKRVKDSMRSGAGGGEVYQPNWFAYEKMVSFLRNKIQLRETLNSEDMPTELSQDYFTNEENKEEPNYIGDEIHTDNETDPSTSNYSLKYSPQKRKREAKDNEQNWKMDETYFNSQSNTQEIIKGKDYLDKYGEVVAERLRQLDERNRDIAINRIDNILFEIKMDQNERFNKQEKISYNQHD